MNTLIVLTVFVTLIASSLAQSKCVSTSNCRCMTGANSFIDLNKITEKLSASRPFEKFTFQLCQKFSVKSKCTGVFGCLVEPLEIYHSLGNSSQFVDSSTIKYQGNDRSAVITLKCDPKAVTDRLTYESSKRDTYNFVLTSKYACAETLTTPAQNVTTTTTIKTTTKTNTTTTATTKTTPKTNSTTASTTKTTPKTNSTTASTTKTTPKTNSTTASTTKTTPASNSTTTTTKSTTKSSTTTPKTTITTPKSSSKSSSTTPKVSSTTVTTKKGAASTVSTITFGSILLAVILSWTLH
ncbi:unnamed protein product [Lymnaea stagnalis]|uniref:MRH domain-containing protein n=1 Tax=Lymnaea stagnalis TaxID=6523 RepID=A0AAV2HHX5_LYMST